jgi:hypothetical protein
MFDIRSVAQCYAQVYRGRGAYLAILTAAKENYLKTKIIYPLKEMESPTVNTDSRAIYIERKRHDYITHRDAYLVRSKKHYAKNIESVAALYAISRFKTLLPKNKPPKRSTIEKHWATIEARLIETGDSKTLLDMYKYMKE